MNNNNLLLLLLPSIFVRWRRQSDPFSTNELLCWTTTYLSTPSPFPFHEQQLLSWSQSHQNRGGQVLSSQNFADQLNLSQGQINHLFTTYSPRFSDHLRLYSKSFFWSVQICEVIFKHCALTGYFSNFCQWEDDLYQITWFLTAVITKSSHWKPP